MKKTLTVTLIKSYFDRKPDGNGGNNVVLQLLGKRSFHLKAKNLVNYPLSNADGEKILKILSVLTLA